MPKQPVRSTVARAVAVLAVALALGGCADSDGDGRATVDQTSSPEQGLGGRPADESPAATPPAPAGDLADGLHPVFLVGIDTSAMTVTFDLVEWHTGEDARMAFQRDHPGEDGPDNDYYIVNNNPRLRTYPVASGVVVIITPGGDPSETQHIAFGEVNVMDQTLFWLTIEGGVVARIEQQWVP